MTGYLARLVDRASGSAAGAIAPTVGPVFPLTPTADDDWTGATALGTEEHGLDARAALVAEPVARRLPEGTTDGAAGALAAAAPPAGPGERPGPRDSPTASPKPPGCVLSEPVPAPTTPVLRPSASSVPSIALRAGSVAPLAAAGAPADPAAPAAGGPPGVLSDGITPSLPTDSSRVEQSGSTDPQPRSRAAARIVAARPVAVELPRSRAAAAAPHEAPRIEVRIGRVEIHRPAPPDPFEWPVAPAADERPHNGFDDLAATRRYVDRRWS